MCLIILIPSTQARFLLCHLVKNAYFYPLWNGVFHTYVEPKGAPVIPANAIV